MSCKRAIWFDFENAPHVWVLSPIIRHFRAEGYPLILTARDFSYTLGLCHRQGYEVDVVGLSGQGRSTATKTLRVLDRALRLYLKLLRQRGNIAVALSHGSRAQALAAHYLGIPVVSLDDYEFSNQSLVRFVDHLLVPFPIAKETWGRHAGKVVHYPGLKEELYLCQCDPDLEGLAPLTETDRVKVLFRPESRFAHYHSTQSAILQKAILNHLAAHPDVLLVLLPRDPVQATALTDFCAERGMDCWLPQTVLDGPALISCVDMMISGGGTMTREAAVLGVPAYSFFAGQWGAVDQHLRARGRLVEIADEGDVAGIQVRKHRPTSLSSSNKALQFVIRYVEGLIS